MDLKNLPDILKFGEVTGEGKKISIVTPIARASFVKLVDAESWKGGPAKFSIDLIFETDQNASAAVDVYKTMVPAVISAAAANRVKPDNRDDGLHFGKNHIFRIGEKFTREGKPYSGYTPTTMAMKLSKREEFVDAPEFPCYDTLGQLISPSKIYGGCYVRARFSTSYSETFDTFSVHLDNVQFVADGEPFGVAAAGMDALPGATPPMEDDPLSAFKANN